MGRLSSHSIRGQKHDKKLKLGRSKCWLCVRNNILMIRTLQLGGATAHYSRFSMELHDAFEQKMDEHFDQCDIIRKLKCQMRFKLDEFLVPLDT
jgi:hypothetical protein